MKSYQKLLLSIFSMLSVSLFPIVFLYSTNIGEVQLSETIKPAIMFIFVSIIVLLVGAIIYKNVLKASFISFIFMLLFTNYFSIETIIRKINYGIRYWHIVAILLFLFAHICYFVYKWKTEEAIKRVLQLGSIMFCGLIIVNVITIIPDIIKNFSQPQEIEEMNLSSENTNNPDIYYIVLDEYSPFETLQKYFNYYPKDFENFLVENGFTVSHTSKNESAGTHINTTNALNLDYIIPITTTVKDSLPYRVNPEFFKVFANQNYDIHIANQNYALVWEDEYYDTLNPFGKNNPEVSFSNNASSDFNKFEILVRGRTPFYILNNDSESDITRENVHKVFDYIKSNGKKSENNKPKLTFAHICSPHQPFVFDENGDSVPLSEANNWSDKKYYLGQYKYITSQLQETIDFILHNNPDSIIILQSDHGPRGGNDETFIEYADKLTIFNTVYYRNEKIDIEGQSALNTLRIVLNKLFHMNYELLEVPK